MGLGLEGRDLSFLQVALRGIIVFVVALVMVRLGQRRFLSKLSAFDAILGFILASMLARAVNGTAAFFPTLAGGFVLIGLHRLLATISFHWDAFGDWVKGREQGLVQEGKLNRAAMKSHKISEADLLEEARLNGQVATLDQVRTAYSYPRVIHRSEESPEGELPAGSTLERNGHVSVIPDKKDWGRVVAPFR